MGQTTGEVKMQSDRAGKWRSTLLSATTKLSLLQFYTFTQTMFGRALLGRKSESYALALNRWFLFKVSNSFGCRVRRRHYFRLNRSKSAICEAISSRAASAAERMP